MNRWVGQLVVGLGFLVAAVMVVACLAARGCSHPSTPTVSTVGSASVHPRMGAAGPVGSNLCCCPIGTPVGGGGRPNTPPAQCQFTTGMGLPCTYNAWQCPGQGGNDCSNVNCGVGNVCQIVQAGCFGTTDSCGDLCSSVIISIEPTDGGYLVLTFGNEPDNDGGELITITGVTGPTINAVYDSGITLHATDSGEIFHFVPNDSGTTIGWTGGGLLFGSTPLDAGVDTGVDASPDTGVDASDAAIDTGPPPCVNPSPCTISPDNCCPGYTCVGAGLGQCQ